MIDLFEFENYYLSVPDGFVPPFIPPFPVKSAHYVKNNNNNNI